MKARGDLVAYLRDLKASKEAQSYYRQRAAHLRLVAQLERAADPLAARRTRYHSEMLEHAARSEYFDPEVHA
jgi:hypothetical protein